MLKEFWNLKKLKDSRDDFNADGYFHINYWLIFNAATKINIKTQQFQRSNGFEYSKWRPDGAIVTANYEPIFTIRINIANELDTNTHKTVGAYAKVLIVTKSDQIKLSNGLSITKSNHIKKMFVL